MSKSKQYSLRELADLLNARLIGDESVIINAIAPLYRAGKGEITFLLNNKYKAQLAQSTPSAVVLNEANLNDFSGNALVMADPNLGYAKLAQLFAKEQHFDAEVHSTAVIQPSAKIAATASIGPHVVIGEHVQIGDGSVIGAGTFVGDDTIIGANCVIYPNVSIYRDVRIQDRVIIHSGAVLGADGFGMANDSGKWRKIPQLGGVMIGNDVEIGANTTIDCGAMDDTIISDGVKLDNQIQIAHNVKIGAHTAIAGCVAIAGSTEIGKHCMIGGKVAITDHISICDQVILTGGTSVTKSITTPGIYSSTVSALPHAEWQRNTVRSRQLDQLFNRVKQLEHDIDGH